MSAIHLTGEASATYLSDGAIRRETGLIDGKSLLNPETIAIQSVKKWAGAGKRRGTLRDSAPNRVADRKLGTQPSSYGSDGLGFP